MATVARAGASTEVATFERHAARLRELEAVFAALVQHETHHHLPGRFVDRQRAIGALFEGTWPISRQLLDCRQRWSPDDAAPPAPTSSPRTSRASQSRARGTAPRDAI
jgi:hypothetical protein